jgi:hypothetical protein
MRPDRPSSSSAFKSLTRVVLFALAGASATALLAHDNVVHPAPDATAAATELTGRIETVTVIDRETGITRQFATLAVSSGPRYRLENAGAAPTGVIVTATGRLRGHTMVVDSIRSAPAQASIAPKSAVRESLTGTIRVFHIDYADQTSEYGYTLAGDNGRNNIVDLGVPPPGVENAARATISGPLDAYGYIRADTIEILAPPSPATTHGAATTVTAQATTTSYAVAPLKFPTNSASPWTYNADPFAISAINSSVFGVAPTKSAAEYYKEVSYGAQLLNGQVINQSNAWLQATVVRPNCSADLNGTLNAINTQAETLAASATPPVSGLNWSSYPGGILYVTDSLNCGWIGLGYIGFARAYSNNSNALGVIGHEMGHNFGLYHAGSVGCGSSVISPSGCTVTEYGDPFVVMGNISAGHFNSYQKSVLGYISSGVVVHSSGTASYTLGPIESSGQTLYAVKIPTSNPNRTYWVEFRQSLGFDAGISGIATLGAQVRLSYPFENQAAGYTASSLYDDTQFLDMTPPGNFTDGALANGQTYSDASTGLSIKVTAASSTALTVQVSMGGASATTTALASSVNPSVQGQSVTFTASVTGTNPTGSVTFNDSSTAICSAVALTGSGNTRTAACTTSTLALGAHSMTATYSGDASNQTSTSAVLSQTVKTASTTALASSLNPSISGASVTFTATVSGSAPTGSVAFTSDGSGIAGCAAQALSGSGNSRTATCATSALVTGAHAIVASYAGDSANGSSTSATLTQTVNASGVAPTTTSVASSQNPSTQGQGVTFTATVAGIAPTGNVAFTSDGTAIAGCGAQALSGSGNSRTAACATSALAAGTHAIVASYAGNAGNAASTSAALSQVVNSGGGAATETLLASLQNPAPSDSTATLVATIDAASPVQGGTVAFADGGLPIAGCNTVPIATSGSLRTATCTATLASGAHSVTATYSGDAASTGSASMVFSQVVALPGIGNTIQFAAAAYAVNEGAGSVTLEVTRLGDSTSPASVSYAMSSGTATANADFTPSSGTLNWGANDSTPRTIAIPIVNDAIAEGNETFTVALSSPSGAALGAIVGTTVTILDDDGAPLAMPGTATVSSNPYGTMSVQGGTLNGNTISNLTSNAVIQLGATAGALGSFAKIDFQGLDIGGGNTLTIRSGAPGQFVYLTNVNGASTSITGMLLAQGGNGAAAPVLVVQSAQGLTVNTGGVVSAPSGLTLDLLGQAFQTGGNLVNQGTVDGGASLTLSAANVNGGGAFKGNAMSLSTFGNLNNPANGSHFIANGLQLYPSAGSSMTVALAGYGASPQFINLMMYGDATVSMPSAWSNGTNLPANNRPVMPGEVRPAGTPDPAYGGGSMIVQSTGALTLGGGASSDYVFPGGVVFIAGGTFDAHGVAIDNGWTTSGVAFQGVFVQANSIDDTVSPNGITVRTNNLNWANFSVRPTVTAHTFTLRQQGDGSAAFLAAETAAPHLNIYGIMTEAGAAGLCWTCLVNGQVMDFSLAP